MVILIPAYKPDIKLIRLVQNIQLKCNYKIVVVDDGSGKNYEDIFQAVKDLGCYVIKHSQNEGKGQALKTGFEYIKTINDVEGVVCADCDGQHLPEDIIRIGNEIIEHKNDIVLGSRKFTGEIPLRSRFGNSLTRFIFRIATGIKLYDTQTGLRGFQNNMLDWLCSIKGKRYEYEMNMLLEAKDEGYEILESDIETVYIEENKSSHFNPVKDSIAIYLRVLKFSISSVSSGIVDFVLLGMFLSISNNLFLSVVGARICSATINYSVNRWFVFNKNQDKISKSLPKYALLALCIMLLNYVVIDFYINKLKLGLYVAKILTEITIYVFSFLAQRKFVFKKDKKEVVYNN